MWLTSPHWLGGWVQHASEDPQDTVALLTHYLFKVGRDHHCKSSSLAGRSRCLVAAAAAACSPPHMAVGWSVVPAPWGHNSSITEQGGAGFNRGLRPVRCAQVLDVPDNIQEVLSACVLIFLVRVLVNRLSVMLPGPPPLPAAAQPPAEPAAAAAAAPGPAAAAIAAAAGAKAGAAAACVGEVGRTGQPPRLSTLRMLLLLCG